jgi:MoaA/NifB/PqqE/SkfB family radical SAM enzyme
MEIALPDVRVRSTVQLCSGSTCSVPDSRRLHTTARHLTSRSTEAERESVCVCVISGKESGTWQRLAMAGGGIRWVRAIVRVLPCQLIPQHTKTVPPSVLIWKKNEAIHKIRSRKSVKRQTPFLCGLFMAETSTASRRRRIACARAPAGAQDRATPESEFVISIIAGPEIHC